MPLDLRPVTEADADFLYRLLQDRPPEAAISHKQMPTMDEHRAFIRSNPYACWYVVHNEMGDIGSAYLSKQDEIGIFVLTGLRGLGLGSEVLKRLMRLHPRKRYLANVSPKNEASANFFTGRGFKLIQNTFELEAR